MWSWSLYVCRISNLKVPEILIKPNAIKQLSSTVEAVYAFHCHKSVTRKRIALMVRMNQRENVASMSASQTMVDVHINVWMHLLATDANVVRGKYLCNLLKFYEMETFGQYFLFREIYGICGEASGIEMQFVSQMH